MPVGEEAAFVDLRIDATEGRTLREGVLPEHGDFSSRSPSTPGLSGVLLLLAMKR